MKYLLGFVIGLLMMGCYDRAVETISPKERKNTPDTITLLFAGDIMCHKPQVTSVFQDSMYNFDGWFQHVDSVISAADIAFANLETTLSSSGPYRGYPRFKTPDALATALDDVGFDVLVTSNNHSNDTGPGGVIHTIDVLKSKGFYQTGTFKNELEKSLFYPLVFEFQGLKIALLNYTYDTNGIPTRTPTMVNLIDSLQIKKDIHSAKKENADMIIAFMHWGPEYHPKPSAKQRQLAKMMIKEGVDHVVGAHPHVVQPVEMISDDNGEHLIAYSLGNFISNQRKKLTDGGVMLEMTVVKTATNTTIDQWRYIPVWRYIRRDKSKPSYEIIPTNRFLHDTTYFDNMDSYKNMIKYHRYLEQHLNLGEKPSK